MRFIALMTLAAFALVAPPQARAQEQRNGQQVIEEFVATRGATSEKPGKAPRKRAAARRGNAAAGRKRAGTAATTAAPAVVASPRPIALGYTILLKDDSGALVVADPGHVFQTGDRIAVALETNANGYLYMFNASGGKNPELLFPNPQLDGGANFVGAHARATFPADPSLDFRFTDPPAAEHLFVVFSREPLPGVPTGEELLRFCGEAVEDCAWRPTAPQWERITSAARGRGVTEARNARLAQGPKQPPAPDALARGLRLRRDDPAPAFVRVNDSPDADVLVTEIVLTHK